MILCRRLHNNECLCTDWECANSYAITLKDFNRMFHNKISIFFKSLWNKRIKDTNIEYVIRTFFTLCLIILIAIYRKLKFI